MTTTKNTNTKSSNVQQVQKMGLVSIILLGINSIIGSGIFLLPNHAYKALGVSSLLLIIAGAILVLSLALCYAEAASKVTGNGSSYLYVKTAFGDFAGFVVGFYQWVAVTIGIAAQFAAILTALQGTFPVLNDKLWYNVVGISLIVILFGITYFGVKTSKIFSNISTIGKLVPMLVFVVVGLFFIKGENFTPFVPAVDEGVKYFSIFGAMFMTIFFAYVGFEDMPIAAAKMENAKKNLPKAIIVVVLFCALIYFLLTFACIGILGPDLANVASPVAQAMKMIFGQWGYDFITLGILISIIGVTFTGVFFGPILLASLGKRGLFPQWFAKETRFGSDGRAIIVTAIIVCFFFLTGGFTWLISVETLAVFVQYVLVALCILKLRKMPSLPQDGFKVPFGPVIPIFAALFALVMASQAGIKTLLYGLGGLVVAVIVWFAYTKNNIAKIEAQQAITNNDSETGASVATNTVDHTETMDANNTTTNTNSDDVSNTKDQ